MKASFPVVHQSSHWNDDMTYPTIHTPRYTIRYVQGDSVQTQPDVWEAIRNAAEQSFDLLDLRGHLFITVIGCDVLGSDPDACGVAVYHEGIQHVAIAGGDGPDELRDDREHWLNEIALSTIHEIVHYWQDLNGTLELSEECEEAAEAKAYELFALMNPHLADSQSSDSERCS